LNIFSHFETKKTGKKRGEKGQSLLGWVKKYFLTQPRRLRSFSSTTMFIFSSLFWFNSFYTLLGWAKKDFLAFSGLFSR